MTGALWHCLARRFDIHICQVVERVSGQQVAKPTTIRRLMCHQLPRLGARPGRKPDLLLDTSLASH